MKKQSLKELYGKDARRKLGKIKAAGLLWGEEMYDTKIIVYPDKINKLLGYQSFRWHLIDVAIILIDHFSDSFYRTYIIKYNEFTDEIYITEEMFNHIWKWLRNDVNLGIELAKDNGHAIPIQRAEDIVDLNNLQRENSTPSIKNGKITYIPKVIPESAKRARGRKQSLLDNSKNLFFYSKSSALYHDRDCERIDEISPEDFMASETVPDRYRPCIKCCRRLYTKVACSPSVKQIGAVGRLLTTARISNKNLEKYVLEEGLKFRADSPGELTVKTNEDTWKINGFEEGRLTLWHNNYVKTSEDERYITDGFHEQGIESNNITDLFGYICKYTYEKHLLAEHRGNVII